MKLSSLAGPAQTKKRLQTLACIACRLSEVCDRKEKDMEHRHIPASKDGSIPSAKTRFWRGEDNFLEDVWYGRCAICGELICPPKYWQLLRRAVAGPANVPYLIAAYLLMINATSETAGRVYLLIVMGFAILVVIFKFILNAYLAFGKWQTFPEGPEAKQLQQRNDRKSERSWWIRALIGWVIAAAVILLYLSLVVRRHP